MCQWVEEEEGDGMSHKGEMRWSTSCRGGVEIIKSKGGGERIMGSGEGRQNCILTTRVDMNLSPARMDFCFRRVSANVLTPSNLTGNKKMEKLPTDW